jgi:hypothetical protein
MYRTSVLRGRTGQESPILHVVERSEERTLAVIAALNDVLGVTWKAIAGLTGHGYERRRLMKQDLYPASPGDSCPASKLGV